MKIAVIGAGGAIGGQITCFILATLQREQKLAIDLFLVFNGHADPAYQAVKENGYLLRKPDGSFTICPTHGVNTYSTLEDLEDASLDLIISVVPATAITESFAQLLNNKLNKNSSIGKVMLAHNGIPCWFLKAFKGYHTEYLNSVDQGGKILTALGEDRIVGTVTHLASSVPKTQPSDSPWIIDLNITEEQGMHMTIGRPTAQLNTHNHDLEVIKEFFTVIKIPMEIIDTKQLVVEIFKKLQLNISINPLSAITQKTVAEMINNDQYRKIIFKLSEEVKIVAKKFRITLRDDKEMYAIFTKIQNHTTSMAQHLLKAKQLENNFMLQAIVELNQLTHQRKNLNLFFSNTVNNEQNSDLEKPLQLCLANALELPLITNLQVLIDEFNYLDINQRINKLHQLQENPELLLDKLNIGKIESDLEFDSPVNMKW